MSDFSGQEVEGWLYLEGSVRAQNHTAMLLELSMSRGGHSWGTGLADPACEVLSSAAKTAECP